MHIAHDMRTLILSHAYFISTRCKLPYEFQKPIYHNEHHKNLLLEFGRDKRRGGVSYMSAPVLLLNELGEKR